MLSQFEWYRRWRGGTFFLHVNGRDWHKAFSLTKRSSAIKLVTHTNSKLNRGRYYTLPRTRTKATNAGLCQGVTQ